MTKPRWVTVIVLTLVGGVWFGQGIGLIPGSFMTGDRIWAAAGAVLLLVAVGVVWSGRSQRR